MKLINHSIQGLRGAVEAQGNNYVILFWKTRWIIMCIQIFSTEFIGYNVIISKEIKYESFNLW